MSNNTKVSLKDVLEVTNRIEDKLDRITERVSVLELWKADITGKLALIGSLFIISFNILWSSIKDKFFKNP